MLDARSDLDCAATPDTIHIAATGVSPPGALEHAFGFARSYNPFVREFSAIAVAQSPSITGGGRYWGWSGPGQPAALWRHDPGYPDVEYTPITSLTDNLVSAADISQQVNSVLMAAYDSPGTLVINAHSESSGGSVWLDPPLKLAAPDGVFSYSPTICAESGTSGSYSVNVVAVAANQLWFANTPRTGALNFSNWTLISNTPESSPDCAVLRPTPDVDAIIHVVLLSGGGTVVELLGNGTNWVTTDLGFPGAP